MEAANEMKVTLKPYSLNVVHQTKGKHCLTAVCWRTLRSFFKEVIMWQMLCSALESLGIRAPNEPQ